VPYTLVAAPFAEGHEWAEPSIGALRAIMRSVSARPAEAAAKGRAAREHVAGSFSQSAVAGLLINRLTTLQPLIEQRRQVQREAARAEAARGRRARMRPPLVVGGWQAEGEAADGQTESSAEDRDRPEKEDEHHVENESFPLEHAFELEASKQVRVDEIGTAA
jgi:hypothetical protein